MKKIDNPCWFLWVIFVTGPKHQQSHPHGLPRQPFPIPNLMPGLKQVAAAGDGMGPICGNTSLFCDDCGMQLDVYEHNLLYSSQC